MARAELTARPQPGVRAVVPAPPPGLGLDFANTVAWRGSTPEEGLQGFGGLISWCVKSGAIEARAARRYGTLDDRAAAAIFAEAVAIREAIYRIFYSVSSGLALAGGDLSLLNRALRRAPARIGVERKGSAYFWCVEGRPPSAPTLLAAVLWSAADLLLGPSRARVRHCANQRCLWLFMDQSKNETRRWCSMQSCGNRAKARRHYLRQRRE